ncbi:SRPBCC family protein [Pseudonocardia abyssalis]|uniref:SRPBCC family protein n=1 Tax=Pseudonocardia abyssalis TaxID=2792008 RepID=A0ABS6UPS8_9PSEU|nr:SRPBCC family protein [Pseudonocardia abyssalis]MBW0117292.1 SRPBCC family protein [Pseudonocardia abyssalis]MBW0134229.1 SRPBCC family protein [Pseudonocardia abyssalis]
MTDVSRSIGTRTVDGAQVRSATIARTYPTDIDDLWEACTTAERIARWFLPVTGDLRVGGRYQLEGNAAGTVEECEAPHRFLVTWEFAGGVSRVTVTLTALDADHTRLELEHVGDVPEDFWDRYGPGATGIGWDLGLLGLARHLDDPSARIDEAAFGASEEGRRFITESGDAWCAAAVAGGLDERAQREAADRSIAFYAPAG